jgi:hypothetical protein
MQARPAYPVDAVGGACFITGRYEIDEGEQIIDLDRDTDAMPMFGRLCVSELAVRQMNACLGWEVDARLQAKVAEQRTQIRELRTELRTLRASLDSIGEALRAAGIVLPPAEAVPA